MDKKELIRARIMTSTHQIPEHKKLNTMNWVFFTHPEGKEKQFFNNYLKKL